MMAIHNNPEQANIFIHQCLSDPDCEVFIHIDKKGLNIKNKIIKEPRVHILPKSYSVKWGDYSQIKYVLYMMRYVHQHGAFDYYSIHSGNDILVQPMEKLKQFLKESNKYAYLDCHKLPWSQWQYGGGMGRLCLIWPKWMRNRLKPYSIKRYIRAIYGRMYIFPFMRARKLPKGIVFYGKSAWYTLRNDCVEDILRYLNKNPGFLDFFRPVLCGDEIFFDTLVMNLSKTDNVLRMVESNNNLRYDDLVNGDKRNVGGPKIITMDDVENIRKSGAFFARKVDPTIDNKVIEYYQCVSLEGYRH